MSASSNSTGLARQLASSRALRTLSGSTSSPTTRAAPRRAASKQKKPYLQPTSSTLFPRRSAGKIASAVAERSAPAVASP